MMLMPKDPSSLDGQTTDYTTGAPYVMFKGTKFVHLMIRLMDTMIISLKLHQNNL